MTINNSCIISISFPPEPDWFAEFDQQRAAKEAVYRLKEEMELKAKREEKLRQLKEEHGTARWRTKRKVHRASGGSATHV